MEELLSVMEEIRDQLVELNSKVDGLVGYNNCSISDVVSEISSIKGSTGYDLTDIHSMLSSIDSELMTK